MNCRGVCADSPAQQAQHRPPVLRLLAMPQATGRATVYTTFISPSVFARQAMRPAAALRVFLAKC